MSDPAVSHPEAAQAGTLAELERQVERGSLFTHACLEAVSDRLYRVESLLSELLDAMDHGGSPEPGGASGGGTGERTEGDGPEPAGAGGGAGVAPLVPGEAVAASETPGDPEPGDAAARSGGSAPAGAGTVEPPAIPSVREPAQPRGRGGVGAGAGPARPNGGAPSEGTGDRTGGDGPEPAGAGGGANGSTAPARAGGAAGPASLVPGEAAAGGEDAGHPRSGWRSMDDLTHPAPGEAGGAGEAGGQPQVPWPGIALRTGEGEDAGGPPVEVNCAERMHVCKAVCCRLAFALSPPEIEAGVVKWDLGHPYMVRHGPDGLCVHNDRTTGFCGVYADRPHVCRRYSCANDRRIWKDFDAMVLNQEWIDEKLASQGRIVFIRPRPRMEDALEGGAAGGGTPSGTA